MPVMPERAQRPSFDGQPSGDRLDRHAGSHGGRVDLQPELRRARRWRSAFDQDGANFVPHIVEPVAQHHADAMFAGRHVAERSGKAKPCVARHRDMLVFFAHVRARQAQFRLAHLLVIEMDGDRRDADGTDRPADHGQMAVGIEVHLDRRRSGFPGAGRGPAPPPSLTRGSAWTAAAARSGPSWNPATRR